jgi:hypothetical protein
MRMAVQAIYLVTEAKVENWENFIFDKSKILSSGIHPWLKDDRGNNVKEIIFTAVRIS